jgi:hypothetical protein
MSNTPKVNRDAGFHSQDKAQHHGGRPGQKLPNTKPIRTGGRGAYEGGPGKAKSPGRAHR